MKRKGATSKVQKIVEEKRYIDVETGEEIVVPVLTMKEGDANFQKIFLGHILEAINSIGNQKVKVLMWMIQVRDTENRIFATQRSIAEETGCAKQTVTTLLASLTKHGIIKQLSPGVYQLSPDAIWKGGHGKRMRVLLDYGKAELSQKKTKSPLRTNDQVT